MTENKQDKLIKGFKEISPEYHLVPKKEVFRELYFDKAVLTFHIKMISIKSKTVYLKNHWESDFHIKGEKHSDEGSCVFTLKGRPMKLFTIEGANPLKNPVNY